MEYDLVTKIKRENAGDLVKPLLDADPDKSKSAGLRLISQASRFGLDLRDYLMLAAKPEGELTGYEMCLAAMNLPVRNDFAHGVVLRAASDTFQTYPGTRAMFPPVMDDILRWAVRQDQFELIAPLVGNSRNMTGNELISTVVNDDTNERNSYTIAEGARVPVNSIRTSEVSVKMYKHGSGIRTTYEFQRRAALDVLTPYIARIARQLEISKVAAATSLLVNGDGVQGAAPVVNQSSYNGTIGTDSANGVISWPHLLYWLVQQAKAMVPVDTIVGNWDSAFRWAMLWQLPITNGVVAGGSNIQQIQAVGAHVANLKIPLPTFAVSSSAPSNKLIGYVKAETLEELVEGAASISESERSIQNQTITYIKTETTGYRLPYGDTRSIFNYGA